MLNFTYFNPVKIVFGKDVIKELETLVPAGRKIMMLYGGGSIKRNGVYDQVKQALRNHPVIEFGGIEPNPVYSTCMKAVAEVKAESVDFLLSVGGGSTLDATKFIAAAAKFAGETPWDILEKGAEVKEALPLGAVLTLPATGSEMNANSVISNLEKQQKLHFTSAMVFPRFSILDPETTFTLPVRQTVNGIVDAFVHVMEQYMTFDVNSPLQNRQAEAVLLTLMEEAPKVLKNPRDYDARANIMWCATHALNGVLCCGVVEDWTTHMIGHELTALYGIDHAQSLAIVLPLLWRREKEHKGAKLLHYGQRIFGIAGTDKDAAIEQAVCRTEEFFHSIGMKTRMADYGIDPADAALKVKNAWLLRKPPVFGEHQNIDADAAYDILIKG